MCSDYKYHKKTLSNKNRCGKKCGATGRQDSLHSLGEYFFVLLLTGNWGKRRTQKKECQTAFFIFYMVPP